jgi:hypothetical protein
VISWSCGDTCQLHVTDLTTGTDAAVEVPRTWVPPSQTYPPPSASLDPWQAIASCLISHATSSWQAHGTGRAAVGTGDESWQGLLPAWILDRRRTVAYLHARTGQPDGAIGSRIGLAAGLSPLPAHQRED